MRRQIFVPECIAVVAESRVAGDERCDLLCCERCANGRTRASIDATGSAIAEPAMPAHTIEQLRITCRRAVRQMHVAIAGNAIDQRVEHGEIAERRISYDAVMLAAHAFIHHLPRIAIDALARLHRSADLREEDLR